MEWAECGKGIASCAHRYNAVTLTNFAGIKQIIRDNGVPYTLFARCTGSNGVVLSYSVYLTQWQTGNPSGSTRAYAYDRTRIADTGAAGVDQEALERTKFHGNDARLRTYTIVYCILVAIVLIAQFYPVRQPYIRAIVNVALFAWLLQNVLTHAWHWEFEEQTFEDKTEYLGIEGADSNEVTIINWSLCLETIAAARLKRGYGLGIITIWVAIVNAYAWAESFPHGTTQALELVGSGSVMVAWAAWAAWAYPPARKMAVSVMHTMGIVQIPALRRSKAYRDLRLKL